MPNTEFVNKILQLISNELGTSGDNYLGSKWSPLLKLEQLVESLITHKMITSTNEEKEKKNLSIKFSTSNNEVDEEVALLSSNLKRFLIQRKEGITRAQRWF